MTESELSVNTPDKQFAGRIERFGSQGRAIDIPPRKDLWDWIYKNYPEVSKYKCDDGGHWVHLPDGWEKFMDSWVPKCENVAVVVYHFKDHPEWKPSYRCEIHKIAARENLIETVC